jgi:hypothetical protein
MEKERSFLLAHDYKSSDRDWGGAWDFRRILEGVIPTYERQGSVSTTGSIHNPNLNHDPDGSFSTMIDPEALLKGKQWDEAI